MAKSKVDYWLTDEGLTLLKGWARDGLTDKEIAHNIGIALSTFYSWEKKYVEFSESLKNGKEVSDYIVEDSLFKRATGFKETFTREKVTKDGTVISYKETVYYPPDTMASIYWLNNRKPKEWRNKQDKDNKDTLEKLDKLLEEQKNA